MASECGCKLDLVIVHASDGPTTDSIINRSECRIADLERQLAEAQRDRDVAVRAEDEDDELRSEQLSRFRTPPQEDTALAEVLTLARELAEWILKDGGYGKSDADTKARELTAALKRYKEARAAELAVKGEGGHGKA